MLPRSFFKRALKLLTVVVVFGLTTLAVIISQGSTFLLVSQISYPSYPSHNKSSGCSLPRTNCTKFRAEHESDDAAGAWYLCILAALLVPELLTFARSAFILVTQEVRRPPLRHILVPLAFQTLHAVGVVLLFLVALPGLTAPKMAAVSASVGLLPAFFKACSDRRASGGRYGVLYKILDVVSLVVQAGSLIMWGVGSEAPQPWALPLGLALTSCGWWEAYLPYDNALVGRPIFAYLREVRDRSLHTRQQHAVNTLVALWKTILYVVLFLSLVPSLRPVENVGELFNDLRLTYHDTDLLTVKPGRPPAILINETYAACGTAAARVTPYVAVPDPTDCSAYWLRVCLAEEPTLSYVLCPGDAKYFSNKKSLTCHTQENCCQASQLVDCTGREDYPTCPNPDLNQMYPSDPHLFPDWRVTVEAMDTAYRPMLFLLVQVLSTLAAYELSYFAFESRIEIFGFAVPMVGGPLMVVAALLSLCSHRMDHDSCQFFEAHVPQALSDVFFSCPADGISLAEFLSDNWIFILAFAAQVWISGHIWTRRSLRLAKAELVFDTPFYDALLVQQSLLLNRRMDEEKESLIDYLNHQQQRHARVIGCATMWHETESEMAALIESAMRIDEAESGLHASCEDALAFEMNIFFDDAFNSDGSLNVFVHQLLHVLTCHGVPLLEIKPTPFGGQLVGQLAHGTLVQVHLKDRSKVRIKKRWSQLMYFAHYLGQEAMASLEKGALDGNFFSTEMARTSAKNTFLLALDGDVVFEPDAIVKLVDLMKRDGAIGATCGRIHPIGSGLIAMYQKFEYAVGHWLQKATEDVLGNVLCAPGCFSLYRLTALLETRGSSGLGPAFEAFAQPTSTPLDCIQHDQGEDRWLCTLLIERGWKVEYCAVSDSYTACPESFEGFYTQRRRWMPSTVANLIELVRLWRSLLRHGNLSIFHLVYQILMLVGSAIGPGSIFILLVGGCQMTFDISYWNSFFLNIIPIITFILVSIILPARTQILLAKVLSMVYAMCMIAVFFAVLLHSWGSCPWAPSTVSLELTTGAFILVGLLHPQELHYLIFGIVYYLTIPCMYMLLPLYCVFNLDDVSWGTRETKDSSYQGNKSSLFDRVRDVFSPRKEVSELSQRLSADIQQLKEAILEVKGKESTTSDVPDSGREQTRVDWTANLAGELTHLDQQETDFWASVIQKYLQPVHHSEEEKQNLHNSLTGLRNEMALLFLFLNAGWALGILLLQMSSVESSAFTIDWVLCEVRHPLNETLGEAGMTGGISNYMPLDPINFVFILFFLIILFIQVIGMGLHRVRTLGHIVASSNIFYQDTETWLDHLHVEDVSVVDGKHVIGVKNPLSELEEAAGDHVVEGTAHVQQPQPSETVAVRFKNGELELIS